MTHFKIRGHLAGQIPEKNYVALCLMDMLMKVGANESKHPGLSENVHFA